MSTYIVIDDTTGSIVNRILLNDPDQWEIPAGHSIVEETATPMSPGGTYIDGVYTPPPPMPVSTEIPQPSPEKIMLEDHELRLSDVETVLRDVKTRLTALEEKLAEGISST